MQGDNMITILRSKWTTIIALLAMLIGLYIVAPNLSSLVQQKGQITVPDRATSQQAKQLQQQFDEQLGRDRKGSMILVFHDEKGLDKKQHQAISQAEKLLLANKKEWHISALHTSRDENYRQQLVAKNGQTEMMLLQSTWQPNDKKELKIQLKQLQEATNNLALKPMFTAEWMVNDAINDNAQQGLKKTEMFTILFIIIVLLIIFRSIVTAIIPLVIIGIAYFMSSQIIAILAYYFNFPLSSYTQLFLVVVLFGIGTDYCILLLSRFKEELAHGHTLEVTVRTTFKTAGKTILFSAITVMVGFAAIGASSFKLYQSAVAVSVGVAVLLFIIWMLLPAVLLILGQKIFYPVKKVQSPAPSRFWHFLGRFSTTKPLRTLLLLATFIIPALLLYNDQVSYNSLNEMQQKSEPIKTFDIISQSFNAGEVLPTTIYIKNDDVMTTADYYTLIEKIAVTLQKDKGIEEVRSLTRPMGLPIQALYIHKQAALLNEGLQSGQKGLTTIQNGLATANDTIKNTQPSMTEATSGIEKLLIGTEELQNGVGTLSNSLEGIQTAMHEGKSSTEQMTVALEKIYAGAIKLQNAHQQLLAGYKEGATALQTVTSNYEQMTDSVTILSTQMQYMSPTAFRLLEMKHPTLRGDKKYIELKEAFLAARQQMPTVVENVEQLNTGLLQLQKAIGQANSNYSAALKKQELITDGLQQLMIATKNQMAGLQKLSTGQQRILQQLPKLSGGLSAINEGQTTVLVGFEVLNRQMTNLSQGLQSSVTGLTKVSGGMADARTYLSDLAKADKEAFNIPPHVLDSKEFKGILAQYMSVDGKIMRMDIILKAHPYSLEAMDDIQSLTNLLQQATKNTKLENAQIEIGGVTSQNVELAKLSKEDVMKTAIIMMIGIFLVLALVFKEYIMPLYLVLSLVLTYFLSMTINGWLYTSVFGFEGLSWLSPFFSFVILLALGIDYSIFLMMRYRENRLLQQEAAMHAAMTQIGSVILCAIFILAGTFAALIPSGMMSLIQIATIVITGLIIYAVLILPLCIPAMNQLSMRKKL